MALATGVYEAVLLWAERPAGRKFYALEFVLTTGERGKAMVFSGHMVKLICCAGFTKTMRGEDQFWSPRDPEAQQPVLRLDLKFSPKYQNNQAMDAHPTGTFVKCDIQIKPLQPTDYQEF